MTNLSPAAQSVINAAVEAGGGYGRATPVLHARIAAALRAVADELASCLFVGPDEGDIKRVIDLSDLHDLIDELEAQ
jgi:DNA topoisomerase IB